MEQSMNIKEISKEIYQNNKEKGFWDFNRNTGEMLMLVVSELSEALEADRKGKKANRKGFDGMLWENDGMNSWQHEENFKSSFKECIKDTFEDEIADAVIRLFDISEGLGIDLEWHIRQKLNYNKTRPKMHGKAY